MVRWSLKECVCEEGKIMRLNQHVKSNQMEVSQGCIGGRKYICHLYNICVGCENNNCNTLKLAMTHAV